MSDTSDRGPNPIAIEILHDVMYGNVVGAAFSRLAAAGIIESIGAMRSRRPRAHQRSIRVWRRT